MPAHTFTTRKLGLFFALCLVISGGVSISTLVINSQHKFCDIPPRIHITALDSDVFRAINAYSRAQHWISYKIFPSVMGEISVPLHRIGMHHCSWPKTNEKYSYNGFLDAEAVRAVRVTVLPIARDFKLPIHLYLELLGNHWKVIAGGTGP